MEKSQDGQTDKEEKLHGENVTTDCPARDNLIEIGNIVIIENKENDMQANTLNKIKDGDQSGKNRSALAQAENLHEVPSINLSDVYSSEKFGHDLLQFIEHGHSLENWNQGSFQDIGTDSFSSHMQIESIPNGPIQQCIDADSQPTNESTLTLTVLNSTNTDDASHPISFSFGDSSTHDSNLIDHDYCMYPKSGYSATENYHGAVDNSALMQPEQYELGMDQEKLQRMKRRKEKNRECSRQFRLKQKTKEEKLKNGKIEKLQNLESLRRNVQNMKTTLSNAAAQCCSECPKARMLLRQYAFVDKENINPNPAYMQIKK